MAARGCALTVGDGRRKEPHCSYYARPAGTRPADSLDFSTCLMWASHPGLVPPSHCGRPSIRNFWRLLWRCRLSLSLGLSTMMSA